MARTDLGALVCGLACLALGGCSRPESPTAPPSTSAATSPAAEATSSSSAISPDQAADDQFLKDRLESAIQHIRSRQLQTTNAFWTVFHGMLGLGPNVELIDPTTGKKVPALKYIFSGDTTLGEIRGARFVPTAHGLDVQIGPVHVGQGHQDQFVAEIAQWGVPADTPVIVYGKPYTMMDFVQETMAHSRVTQSQELSWAIVVVAQYIGTDAEWTNRFGEKLHYEDVVRYELNQNVENAACGGTHRLFGLTWGLYSHIRSGGKMEGVWREVRDKLDRYVAKAKADQNPDGSFSSQYFRDKGHSTNAEERLGSSGHILEWLATYLSDEGLREDWMREAALAVSLMILDAKDMPIESGALYHATHGLVTYKARMFSEAKGREEKTDTAQRAEGSAQ